MAETKFQVFWTGKGWQLVADPPITGDEPDPLGLSICKWETIVRLLKAGRSPVFDGGTATCALCARHYGNQCQGCPVRVATGYEGCQRTPYMTYTRAFLSLASLLGAAKAEVKFLRSLRRRSLWTRIVDALRRR